MNCPPTLVLTLLHLIAITVIHGASDFTRCQPPSAKAYDQWYSYKNGSDCYMLSTQERIFNDAMSYCRDRGAHLLSIHSDEENKLIMSFAKERLAYSYSLRYSNIFLGLRRNPETGEKSHWSDGTPVDYAKWDPLVDQSMEHCGYIKPFTGLWYHSNCAEGKSVICKVSINNPVPPPPPPEPKGNCPEGWVRNGNLCYQVVGTPDNFSAANDNCRYSEVSDLVSIHSKEQQLFLTALLGASTNSSAYWLGGYKGTGGRYMWKSNEKFDYTNWLDGRSPYRYSSDPQCVQILLDKQGQWGVDKCDQKLPYVCMRQISEKYEKPSTTLFPTTCPSNPRFYQYGDTCFSIFGLASFEEAESNCVENGGHLASISNYKEFALTQLLMQQLNVRNLWLGLKGYVNEHETFQWVDGSHLYFTNWGKLTPQKSNSTQCVYQQASGQWQVTDECEAFKSSLCKIYLNGKPSEKKKPQKKCPVVKAADGSVAKIWTDLDTDLDYCYRVGESSTSNGDAHLNCIHMNGTLASIHSEHEAKLLADFAKKKANSYSYSRDYKFWIGLYRKAEGGFWWIDNSPVDYLSWDDQEPSNVTDYVCVVLDKTFSVWRTRSCSSSYDTFYICSAKKIDIEDSGESGLNSASGGLLMTLLVILILVGIVVVLVAAIAGFKYVMANRQRDDAGISFTNENFASQQTDEIP